MKTLNERLKMIDECVCQLYLEHWQLGESGYDCHEESGLTQEQIASLIISMGFPDPNTIIYDNEAVPWVNRFWVSENFDATEFITGEFNEE